MADKRPKQRVDPIVELPAPPLKKAEDYLKAYSSWVYTATSAIAQEVASIELKLVKKRQFKKGIVTEEIFEHESLSLLHYVNDYFTFYDLVEATQIYLELMGEAFWVVLKSDAGPTEIWPLRPDWVTVVPSEDNFVDHYEYGPGKDKASFVQEQVIHFKYFNPINPYRGRGTVQAAAMEIDTDVFSAEWNRSFFFNNAMPGLVFASEKKLKKEEMDRFISSWRAKLGGRGNSHKIGFLTGAIKLHEIGGNFKEMGFAEQRAMMRDNILAFFKVPKTVVGMVEDVNRANAFATNASFIERVVRPKMLKFVNSLNEFYLPMIKNTEGLFFDFHNPVPQDVQLNLRYYENGLQNGWLKINEVRAMEGLDPVEGGDQIRIPTYGFALLNPDGTAGDVDESDSDDKPDDEQNPNSEPKPDEDKEDDKGYFQSPALQLRRNQMVKTPPKRMKEIRVEKMAKDLKPELVKIVSKLMGKKENGVAELTPEEKQKRDQVWKDFIIQTDKDEAELGKLMNQLFLEQQNIVLTNLENVKYLRKVQLKGKVDDILFSLRSEIERFASVTQPFIKDMIIEKAREVLAFLGMGGELELSTPDVVSFLLTTEDFVKSANGTTRDQLREAIAEGVKEGESIPQLRDRIEAVYGDAIGFRSQMIARSEVIRASNFAAEASYIQSGVVEGKEWLTALDERVCPWCKEMDGQILGLKKAWFKTGDTFTVTDDEGISRSLKINYSDIRYPPIHPQCRCTLIPVISEKDISFHYKAVQNSSDVKTSHSKHEHRDLVDVKEVKKNG